MHRALEGKPFHAPALGDRMGSVRMEALLADVVPLLGALNAMLWLVRSKQARPLKPKLEGP